MARIVIDNDLWGFRKREKKKIMNHEEEEEEEGGGGRIKPFGNRVKRIVKGIFGLSWFRIKEKPRQIPCSQKAVRMPAAKVGWPA